MVITWVEVLLAAFLTAIATGLGALPFAFKSANRVPKTWLGYANAMAAGLMLAASFSLVIEGYEFSSLKTLLGMLIGMLLVRFGDHLIDNPNMPGMKDISNAGVRQGILIIAIMTIHSAAEGIGIGVAFGGGEALGIYATIAIAIHNIPEGLAISLVTVPKGMRWWVAGLWSIFSSLPQPLLALPSYIFVQVFEPFLPIGLGVAAGAMFWMVFAEIVPEANEDADSGTNGLIITGAIIAMLAMQAWMLG